MKTLCTEQPGPWGIGLVLLPGVVVGDVVLMFVMRQYKLLRRRICTHTACLHKTGWGHGE